MTDPYWRSDDGRIVLHQGDCRHVLAQLPAESVSACVTSPPFWGLRAYECEPVVWGGWRGQYGSEPSVSMYVEHTMEWLRLVKRVLRKDGVCWVDIDDSRHGSWGDYVKAGEAKNKRSGKRWNRPGYEQASYHERPPTAARGALHKSLCLIPQKLAIAAQEDGWIVRSQIVIAAWMPESARDRPTDAYRTLLMLTKSKHFWYDGWAVRVIGSPKTNRQSPIGVESGPNIADYVAARGRHGVFTDGQPRAYEPGSLRNLGNLWTDISSAAHPSSPSFRHFAVMPLKEVERCLLASVPEAICTKCGKARVRVIARQNVREHPAREGRKNRNKADFDGGGYAERESGLGLAWDEKTIGWTDCGCGAGLLADDVEIIETPTGDRVANDPSLVTGRAGYNRPRGPNEGSRPITRYEQRRYAEQLRRSPRWADMAAEAGPAFAHYRRRDKSGARPIPPELLAVWIERGWLERVVIPEMPPVRYEPGVVLDPFAGTGTTLLAAQKLGRKAIGIELSGDYCRQAVTRLMVGDRGIRRLAAAENDGARQEVLW